MINGYLFDSISLLESKEEANGLFEAVGVLEAFFTELLPDFFSDPEGLFSFFEADVDAKLFLAEEDALLAEEELFWAAEEDFLAEEADAAELFLVLADETDSELFFEAEDDTAELFCEGVDDFFAETDGLFWEEPDFVDLLLSFNKF